MSASMEQHEIEIAFSQHFNLAEQALGRLEETSAIYPSTIAKLQGLAEGHATLALACATAMSGKAIAEATRQSAGMR